MKIKADIHWGLNGKGSGRLERTDGTGGKKWLAMAEFAGAKERSNGTTFDISLPKGTYRFAVDNANLGRATIIS